MIEPAAPLKRVGALVRTSPNVRDAVPALAVFAALVGTAFENGGFFPGTWTTTAVGFLWLVALALLLGVRVELTAFEAAWLGLLAAVILWTALSIVWSLSQTESVFEVRRDLVYFAAAAALLLLATRGSSQHVLAAVWAAITVVVVYALARYLFALEPRSDQFQVNLLFRPLGYANAVGIFAGIASIAAIVLAVRGPDRLLRRLALASVAPLTAAVCLTTSRASALAIALGVVVMFVLDRNRVDLVSGLLVVAPAALLVAAACAWTDLTSPSRASGAVWEARILALWIALNAVALSFACPAVKSVGGWLASRDWPRRGPAAAVLAAVVLLGAAFIARGRVETFFTTGYRPTYWHVAWIQAKDHPLLGSGAGTFADYWLRYGSPTLQGGALDAHNLYLETLAELGPFGLLLLASMLALPLVAAFRARRHPFAPAAAGAYAAFLAHAALDWDWEMPAVALAAFACAAVVLLAHRDRAPAHALSPRLRAGVLTLTLALAVFALAAELVPGLRRPFP
jgi:hypothetical protein